MRLAAGERNAGALPRNPRVRNGDALIRLPIIYSPATWPVGLSGATWDELEPFYAIPDPIRRIERGSIRTFMAANREFLRGRVLDLGAGTQPYRDLVDGEYVPIEKGERSPDGSFDSVMCNQVVQYLDDVAGTLRWQVMAALRRFGYLVMTYPTNWEEVESSDLRRFTKSGMEQVLRDLKFSILKHEERAAVMVGSFRFTLGYGVVARLEK